MRGRGAQPSSSSSVTQDQTRMALRKQTAKDVSDVPSESRQIDEDTQEDEAIDDADAKVESCEDELSSSLLSPASARQKRMRERENKSKTKEMTEEEMMDLALRLSEQEASNTALRLQQEEEAMMKAIQESMVGQTQQCPPSQSQSLLAEASLRLCPRRKLLYSNGKRTSAVDQGASEETDLNRDVKGTGSENNNRNKKRRRKEGSPLLEMPDLSQTQASPCSSESELVLLDSPQSSDSTQIDDCQLRKSPVFPLTGCRAEVHVPRLNQGLLETCRTSGFVLCSQDSQTSTQKPLPAQPKSPTFPKSPGHLTVCPKSPDFSETNQGDDAETQLSPEYLKSPVFGRSTRSETSPSACKPQVCNTTCENSGFTFTSQESLTSTVRSTSCQPKSPVFPRSPGRPEDPLPPSVRKSSVLPKTDRGPTEESQGRSASPVFGRTGRQLKTHLNKEKVPAAIRDPAQSLTQDNKIDRNQVSSLNKTNTSSDDDVQELNATSKDCNSLEETELTSDMTLLWSDEDEDVTPVGSPSPVFPEERPVHQADSRAASLNHITAASPGTNCSLRCVSRRSLSTLNNRSPNKDVSPGPSSSSASTCGQQHQGAVRRAAAPPGEPAGGPMVHYYWGVPFCPRGLDPDAYTQVILAQMDVYNKSLKQAQRCLLRKAEWGEAILPQPEKSPSLESPAESPEHHVPRRRGLRLRGKKLCDADEEEEERKDGEEEQEEREKEKEKEEENNEEGEIQVDTDDCEVCPETQLSNNDDDDTQDLTMAVDAGVVPRIESPDLPEVEMILRDDSPAGAKPPHQEQQEQEEEMEVDAPVDGKTEGNVPVSGDDMRAEEAAEDGEDPDVEEIKDGGLKRSTSPELELPASVRVPQSPEAKVDCPICQGSFPVTKIELHAAYCDGEVAVVDERRPDCFQVSLKPRRKRTRRLEFTEETNGSSNSGKNQEKCYICQKAVPLRDYSRHTELCIQRQASKTEAKGNLLSALDQTENRDSEAGPSGSKLQPREVIDLRDDDDDDEEEGEEEGGVSGLRVSNSPIRSFTPISEATGCLIDFKKQQRAKKPSQRRR
ncbi:BRCA1-A complex subunit RAP80 isoform X2 [Lates calcarifer]|uniref:BRCA1-A complex subunit RAP80 isoform X2 n=1 Tax=Lates calcarifer TaxID=8187 RepID=A0AAJ8BLK6_LATCA|nr:BRCA1-A complex subunit RAP80 isoform X2 [Lates calcarifer]XP_050934811.1 BRCA1-A complex subunit RAP80 isoform X2 [Lates calcarifer]